MRGGRAHLQEDIFFGCGLCKVSQHLEAALIYKRDGSRSSWPRGSAASEGSCSHVHPLRYHHCLSHYPAFRPAGDVHSVFFLVRILSHILGLILSIVCSLGTRGKVHLNADMEFFWFVWCALN